MPSLRLPSASRPADLLGEALLESALTIDSRVLPIEEFHTWFAEQRESGCFETIRIRFADLDDWYWEDGTGDLRHRSGRFFSIAGLDVRTDYGQVPSWCQPIILQPEIGILGILVKRIGGVLHCLMQAKMEPGNVNTLQLSPTVQATRSNYTRVHNGGGTPYMEYFSGDRRGRVLVDTLQSEQGTWFYQKRNRNMVVETSDDVPAREGFCWLTLGQLRRLLAVDNLVNMPARTVLSCVPFLSPTPVPTEIGTGASAGDEGFGAALAGTLSGRRGSPHSLFEVLSWLTEAKTRYALSVRRAPLNEVSGWRRMPDRIVRDDEKFFRVIAVSVDADTREVHRWTQPMVEPVGQGIAAFIARRFGGVVHVLAQARLEPGYLDMIEVGPTVRYLPGTPAPRYLDDVLGAPRERVRFDAVQSEEGGRFYHAMNRYMIIEAGPEFGQDPPPDYRWVAADQLVMLLAHSRYLNVEARTLVACLHSLW